MYALWIDEDAYVGDIHHRKLAIAKGDIRKVHAKSGSQYILEGSGGKGTYGWVDAESVIVAETKKELEQPNG